jgi:glycosyltransferase involved in cell wall biosynthesis
MNGPKGSRPHRVLMLVENLSFPWDRRMRHLARALQQSGYSVCVISPKGESQDRRSFEEIDGVKVYRYPSWQAGSGRGYIVEYTWAFFCTVVLSLFVWMRHGIDIIHSANPPDFFFLLAWPLKLLGKKYVFDEHDVSPELYEAKFHRRDWVYHVLVMLERASYHVADLVLATNESYRDIARERGRIPDAQLAIVRNGVDMGYFRHKPPRPELKESFAYMALYLGVMGRQDGVDCVIHAAHHLVHTCKRRDVLFVLIGKGECSADLQNLTRDLQLESFVHFLGYVSDELLLDYLSTADVCLAPDPPDRMNQVSTMTKILEYMACKRPIVSFDLLESRRSAGEAAIYVEKKDDALFAAAINDLLNDRVRREQMGRAGLERSIHLIGWDRSRQCLLEAYSRLSGEKPAFTGKLHIHEQMHGDS